MADQVIQEIKDRLSVSDVIGSYIQLKRAGSNFKANCPFHNEKTPSFHVNPGRQIWHCFGCNEGGDIFTFVQKYENLDFPGSLKVLADKAGVRLPERKGQNKQQSDEQKLLRERLFRINAFAGRFYHAQLMSSKGQAALQYLQGRGLTLTTIQKWQIGLALSGSELLRALESKQATIGDAVASGVITRATSGRLYERFFGRVTFPIRDVGGAFVGFSARTLDSSNPVKYINSPESPVYSKGRVLFGLYEARPAIREAGFALMVEGQMDCIKAHQVGAVYTVATSGTAVTLEQLRLLLRFTNNLKLCFDRDAAGQAAAKKTGSLALGLGFAVKMVNLPSDAKDPDELISKDAALWQQVLQNSKWFLDDLLDQAETGYPARSREQRQFVTLEILPVLQVMTDLVEKEHYLRSLSESFGLSSEVIKQMLADQPGRITTVDRLASGMVDYDMHHSVQADNEKLIMAGLMDSDILKREWLALGGQVGDFQVPDIQLLAANWLSGGVQDEASDTLAKEIAFMLELEKTNQAQNSAAFYSQLRRSILNFRLTSLKAQQQQLAAAIRSAATSQNDALLGDLQRQFVGLSDVRLEIEKKLAN